MSGTFVEHRIARRTEANSYCSRMPVSRLELANGVGKAPSETAIRPAVLGENPPYVMIGWNRGDVCNHSKHGPRLAPTRRFSREGGTGLRPRIMALNAAALGRRGTSLPAMCGPTVADGQIAGVSRRAE